MAGPKRRELLASTALALLSAPSPSLAEVIQGEWPWIPGGADPPTPVQPGPWKYLTAQEAAAVEALMDRLIPPDPETPGGKETECAVFIDGQLAGARSVGTAGAPTASAMPPFDWRLTDDQVAAVTTYVRNAWGNAAPAVATSDVSTARTSLVKRSD